jgi:hypothetical protein
MGAQGMGAIVKLQNIREARRTVPLPAPAPTASVPDGMTAEILLFTGVRYERLSARPQRVERRRDVLVLPD